MANLRADCLPGIAIGSLGDRPKAGNFAKWRTVDIQEVQRLDNPGATAANREKGLVAAALLHD